METKYVRVPFEVELAKRIQNKECEGRIVTRDGRDARIICWDKKSDCYYNIVALINCVGTEKISTYNKNGYVVTGKEEYNDLLLEIPEYMTFKDGDVLISSIGNPFIFNGRISKYGSFGSYCGINSDGDLILDSNEWTMKVNGYANEKQKNILIGHLKRDWRNTAKEYLERFFPNHSNSSNIGKKFEFNPFDKVLVRDNGGFWICSLFSHISKKQDKYKYITVAGSFEYCIPYNEQTAHLLGTTENYE